MNKVLPAALMGLAMLASCAKLTTQTDGQFAQSYYNLWCSTNYPNLKAEDSGILILEDTPGTGEEWTSDYPYVLNEFSIRNFSGTITSTSDKKLAQQLGTYSPSYYYGPSYQQVGENHCTAAFEAVLKGMRVGGTRTAAVPAWLITNSRYDSESGYVNANSSNTHYIYTVKLEGMTADIVATETDSLKNYVKRVYGADVKPSTFTDSDPDGTFYFISDSTAFKGKEKRDSTATLKLNYTGRLLDGTVFDTTVEYTAKEAGTYNYSTYSPVSITFSSNYNNIKMGDSSELIDGFKGGLSLMKWPGQKAVIIFTSALGYGESGSGDAIPSFAPLLFELELLQ